MVRFYPAIEIKGGDPDLISGLLDDFSPTAIEERDGCLRAFFASADARGAARVALADRFQVAAVDVSDEDWARRSQEHLQPVTVGRITIRPNPESQIPSPDIVLVIQPSMGFGTGHHATTRLCLEALQHVDVAGKRVLDVGTGSGILAIAADRLGAASALGIDVDEDAIQSARENLALNPKVRHVRFEVADLAAARVGEGEIVLANLTGGLLTRAATTLRASVASDGVLIVSGLQRHERDEVLAALRPEKILWQRDEDEWSALAMRL
jgi:ribosomal protein L11 methyltransferase